MFPAVTVAEDFWPFCDATGLSMHPKAPTHRRQPTAYPLPADSSRRDTPHPLPVVHPRRASDTPLHFNLKSRSLNRRLAFSIHPRGHLSRNEAPGLIHTHQQSRRATGSSHMVVACRPGGRGSASGAPSRPEAPSPCRTHLLRHTPLDPAAVNPCVTLNSLSSNDVSDQRANITDA